LPNKKKALTAEVAEDAEENLNARLLQRIGTQATDSGLGCGTEVFFSQGRFFLCALRVLCG